MFRHNIEFLKSWKSKKKRKPLVVRGARQVGKSWLIREFAKNHFSRYIEVNFDETPELADMFVTNDPVKIIHLLGIRFGGKIIPDQTLLFLDEIQSTPQVMKSLRYFYEKMPELAVIAAGSLLDFALADKEISMPVGRVEFLFMAPMSFGEFLEAMGKTELKQFMNAYHVGDDIPLSLHGTIMEQLRIFLAVGGMPEAVSAYVTTGDWQECDAVKRNLLSAFHEDFGKYAKKVPVQRLKNVFQRIPRLIGEKIKYVRIDPHERAKDISACLDMLCQARLCYRVHHVSANGMPLGAEMDDKIFKLLFLDVGLVGTACRLSLGDFLGTNDPMVNQGAVCEQFIGQHLLTMDPPHYPPELYYWVREALNAAAEMDYIVACDGRVVPIEIKSGKTGTLKSLHQFIVEKKSHVAVRFNADVPSRMIAETANPGNRRKFTLLSLPLYMVEQTRRLVSAETRAYGEEEAG